jgi:cytochrome c oxidase subunit 2
VLGGEIDSIYYMILVITGVIFLFVEVALVFFILRYRRREGRAASYVHGHTKTEIVWTVIPLLLVVWIAWSSASVWMEAKASDRSHDPASAYPLRVTAKQFEWTVTYPGPDGRLDSDDDFVKLNQLHLPVDRDIRVELRSEDVIHSFFLPEFRVKQDAVPGMMIPVWFRPTVTGEFPLACAELCGVGHTTMNATVTVHDQEGFDRWNSEEATVPAAAAPASLPANEAGRDSVQVSTASHEEDHS